MSIILRDYQNTIVSSARDLMKKGERKILVEAPTGSGKTALTGHMMKSAAAKKMDSWFIVHRRELIKQSVKTFDKVDVFHGVVAANFPMDLRPHVQVASISTLINRIGQLRKPKLIIWDECFVAGTLVGDTPIEHLKIGDSIAAFNEETGKIEQREVISLFKKRAPDVLYSIKVSDKKITCTGNHPFYVIGKGWINADKLSIGDQVYELSGLQQKAKPWSASSLLEMLSLGYDRAKQNRISDQDEREKSDGRSSDQREGVSNAEKDRPQAKVSWWKWKATIYSSRHAVESSWSILVCRGRRLHQHLQRIWPFDSLQNRHSELKKNDCNRGGWKLPLFSQKTGSRSEKTNILRVARVEGVEIHERSGSGRHSSLCADGFVYNIEVKDLHTYTANGIVVHNCHHLAAGTWRKIFQAFPDAFHIGLTATPERLDGKGLKDFFNVMIKGPSVKWLIENKYLSPYKAFAPPGISISGVHTRMGDFVRSELASIIDKPTITGDAIREYKLRANGKRNVVFCVSIEHSKHVVEQFNLAGITAAHVDGESTPEHRDWAIKQFEEGKIKVLSNVDLFGEGFDLPSIECVTLLRPTQSLGLYLQQVGRSLRTFPGKDCAIILDHAGNIERHGLPDEPREWTLEGREISKKQKPTEPSVRVCPKCFAAQMSGKSVCIYCGQQFEIKARKINEEDGELKEIDYDELSQRRAMLQRNREQGTAQSLQDLIALGKARGYKRAELWARHVFISRQRKGKH